LKRRMYLPMVLTATVMRMSERLYLGIDTSNYTTSVALGDDDGNVILNHKILLSVKEGERGLRQSDAVFQHIKNADNSAEAVREAVKNHGGRIAAVGVSATPTYRDGSYMPCFMAGLSQAQMIAASLDVPMYTFSHQAGHIMAALYSSGAVSLSGRDFIAFHVSGGTTDIITVRPDKERVIYPETVGGSTDINAGQAIDRVGVMMGLRFPAGPEMEQLAKENTKKLPRPLCTVSGISCNLSGLENKAKNLFTETGDKALVAAYTIESVGATLEKMLLGVIELYGNIPVVFAGGVMSCKAFSDRLSGGDRYFAEPRLSSDNACGTMLLARARHNR